MFAVLFEVYPAESGKDRYFAIAAGLREFLKDIPGFISVERFESLTDRKKLLSVSFWETEDAIEEWRNQLEHRIAQKKGINELFVKYRIRVVRILRDYTASERARAPADSNAELGGILPKGG